MSDYIERLFQSHESRIRAIARYRSSDSLLRETESDIAHTQATNDFFTTHAGLALAFTGGTVFAQWYALEDTEARHLATFDLSALPALPLQCAEAPAERQVWPPPPRAPPRYPRSLTGALAMGEAAPLDIAAEEPEVLSEPEGDAEEGCDLAAELEEMLEIMESHEDDAFFEPPPQEATPPAPAVPEPTHTDPDAQLVVVAAVAAPASVPLADASSVQPQPGAADSGPQEVGRRGRSALTFIVPGGMVAFYENKQVFQATCDNAAHGMCKLTRTCRGTASGSSRAGRPVAFLAAWLANGQTLATKEDHWRREVLDSSLEQRRSLRERFKQSPDGLRLLSFERPAGPGEPEEPENLGPYLR